MTKYVLTRPLSSILLLMLCLAAPIWARGKELRVPDQYRTISAAALAAEATGDKIVVTDRGTYRESILINKSLEIVSNPAGAVIESPKGSGLILSPGASLVKVEGFTIQNCPRCGIQIGSGEEFLVNLTLSGVNILANKSDGIGIYSGDKHKLVVAAHSLIKGNQGCGINCLRPAEVQMTESSLLENGATGLNIDDVSTNSLKVPSKISVEACSVSANKQFGIVLNSRQSSSAILINKSTIDENAMVGLAVTSTIGCSAEVALTKTSVRKNLAHGIGLSQSVQARLEDCKVVQNGNAGLDVHCDDAGGTNPKRLAQVSIKNCSFQSNKWNNIELYGKQSLQLTVVQSEIDNAEQNGLFIKPDDGYSAELKLSQTSFSGNLFSGISILRPMRMDLDTCKIRGNRISGLTIDRDEGASDPKTPVRVTLEDCAVTSNSAQGMDLRGKISADLTVTQSTVEYNKNNGLCIMTQDGYNAKAVLAKTGLNRNGGHGIELAKPIELRLEGCQLAQNDQSGIKIHRDQSGTDPQSPARLSIRDCSLKSNKAPGIELSGKLSAKLTITQSAIEGNNANGLLIQPDPGYNVELALTKTSVNRNLQDGATLSNTVRAHLVECKFIQNRNMGLGVHSDQQESSNTKSLAQVTVEHCSFNANTWSNIGLYGKQSLVLSVIQSEIEGAKQNGLFIKPDDGYNAELNLSRTSLSGNLLSGIDILRPARMNLEACKIINNGSSGVEIAEDEKGSDPESLVRVTVNDCTITSNSAQGMSLGGKVSSDLTVTQSSIEHNKSDGLCIMPEDGYGAAVSLTKTNLNQNNLSGIQIRREKGGAAPQRPIQVTLSACSLRSNKEYGLALSGHLNTKLTLSEAVIENNTLDGLQIQPDDGYSAEVSMTKTSASRNLQNGAALSNAVQARLVECKFDHNQNMGLNIHGDQEGSSNTKNLVRVSVANCTFNANAWNNIGAYGKQSLLLTVTQSEINNAEQNGFYIKPDDGYSAELNLSRTSLSGSLLNGINILRPARMNLDACNISRNRFSGLAVNRDEGASDPKTPVRVTLKDCTVTSNAGEGMSLQGKIGSDLTVTQSTIEHNKNNGFYVMPEDGYDVKAALTETNLNGNGWHGIELAKPIELRLEGCQLAQNDQSGLRIHRDQRGTDPQRFARISIRDCSLKSNKVQGLELSGKLNTKLAIAQSAIEGNNANGLLIQPDPGYGAELALTTTSLCNNAQKGIFSLRPVQISLEGCKVARNGSSGFTLYNDQDTSNSKGQSQVTIRNCSITSNKAFGLDQGGKTSLISTISQSVLEDNAFDGIFIAPEDGYNTEMTLAQTRINKNANNGIEMSRPAKISMAKCTMTQNGGAGLRLLRSDGFSQRSAQVTAEDCAITSNSSNGVDVQGALNTTLSFGQSLIEGNKNGGLYIQLEDGYRAKAALTKTNLTKNGENGISLRSPMEASLDECKISQNGLAGLQILKILGISEPKDVVRVTARNCSVNSNKKDGVELFGKLSSSLAIAESTIEKNEGYGLNIVTDDGFSVDAKLNKTSLCRNAQDGIGLPRAAQIDLQKCTLAENGGSGLKIRREEKDSDLKSSARVTITDSSLTANKKYGLEIFGKLNSILALSQSSFAGNKIAEFIADPGDKYSAQMSIADMKLKSIINDPLILVIPMGDNADRHSKSGKWLILSHRYVSKITNTSSAEEMLGNIKANGRVMLTPVASDKLQAIDHQSFPLPIEQPQTGLAKPNDLNDLCLFLRRCEDLSSFIEASRCWLDLGQMKMAKGALIDANKIWPVFHPGHSVAYVPPECLRHDMQASSDSLSLSPKLGANEVIKLSAASHNNSDLTSCVTARLHNFKRIMYLDSQMRDLPERPGTSGEKKSIIMQIFLDDLIKLLHSGVDGSVISHHLSFLGDELLPYFSAEEKSGALHWFEDQVRPLLDKSTNIGPAYHQTLANIYKGLGDASQEEEQLSALVKSAPKSAEALAAYNRLTDLYLDFWKLPAKAVEPQREIIKYYAGSENEYKARFRIANIFYNQKEYEKAIFELTKLTEKIPNKFKEEPVKMMLGLAYVGTGDYADARNEFAKVINKDQGENRERCLYLTGYTYICEQRYNEAVKPLKDLINLYPQGQFSEKARNFIGKIERSKN